MRLGAVDYLVKLELEEEFLTAALKKAVEICEYNRKKGIAQGEQGDVFEDTLEEKIQNYFQRILIYDARIKGQEAVENIIGERYGNMALMLINFNYGFEGFSPAFTREDQKKVMDFAENIISGMVKGFSSIVVFCGVTRTALYWCSHWKTKRIMRHRYRS